MLACSSLAVGLWLLAAAPEPALLSVPDPHASLVPESDEARKARHDRVARARAGTILLLHRGAWEYAPENTLSGIRAAFELGANGIELDFRRTKDGAIVFFHDDRLERLLDGVGSIEESYYEELLLYTFAALPAPAAEKERVPTLGEVLQMVRDHAGLLHLDIKTPGIDDELLAELRQADMLDHVVTYNDYNSQAFRQAGVAKLPFKGSLMDAGRDTDPHEAERVLKRPGNLVIADDPRAVLTQPGKAPVRVARQAIAPLAVRPPTRLDLLEAVLRGTSSQMPERLAAVRLAIQAPRRFAELAVELHSHPNSELRRALAWNLGMLAKHRPALLTDSGRAALLRLLNDRDIGIQAEAAVACGRARMAAATPILVGLLAERPRDLDQWTEDPNRLRQKRPILEARARYAFALGLAGVKNREVVEILVDTVKHRGIDPDLALVGIDGAMAARALGKLRAAEAVVALKEALFREDEALAPLGRSSAPRGKPAYSPGWLDFQVRTAVLEALAEIASPETLGALETVVNMGEKEMARLSPYLRAQAASALASHHGPDALPILARLLGHDAAEVRRSAVLACLKRSDPRCRALLEGKAAWATPWWNAQHPFVCPASRLAAEYRLYWGDVHTHTNLSDGKGSLDELLTYARDVARLDFVIVTDHDFGNGPPWRMSRQTWNEIQHKVESYTVDGKFVAIAGYEWTSQPKYWTEVGPNQPSERLFPGPPKFYNHKNVYFPARVEQIFSAKDSAYHTPDLLAEAVRKAGGLIHNNHPVGDESRDQWEYAPRYGSVIVNTEMGADTMRYRGKTHQLNWEQGVREFLGRGGKSGFVGGTDTHEGKPAARTAVLARALTRGAIFEALGHRRNYAVSHARIELDFRINGHRVGEEITVAGAPEITVSVTGTAPIREAVVIRDGAELRRAASDKPSLAFVTRDQPLRQPAYYYLRVTQDSHDEHGNPAEAWSSPIWVKPAR